MAGITNFGGTFAISTTTQDTDLNQSGFEGLTYTTIPNIGNVGTTGVTQNVVSYPTWDKTVTNKAKGEANAGDVEVEFVDAAGAGMDLMKAAGVPTNTSNYAFKITWPDGSVEYNRGLVTGPRFLKGGNEDFKRIAFTLGMQQVPVSVDAP